VTGRKLTDSVSQRSGHQNVQTVWFHVNEILEQMKLIDGLKNQNHGWIWDGQQFANMGYEVSELKEMVSGKCGLCVYLFTQIIHLICMQFYVYNFFSKKLSDSKE
jgi:hypothetical protein